MDTALHWAADLIGRPYRKGARGPDAFDCWGLVRYVFAEIHGVDMPVVTIGPEETDSNTEAIKRAADVSGWRPTSSMLPAEHDIALMSKFAGRHVGVIVAANGGLHLLHSLDPVGVCLHSIPDCMRMGFHDFAFWRRA